MAVGEDGTVSPNAFVRGAARRLGPYAKVIALASCMDGFALTWQEPDEGDGNGGSERTPDCPGRPCDDGDVGVLSGRTKLVVLTSIAVAAVAWSLLFGAMVSVVAGPAVGVVIGIVLGVALVVLFPERRMADRVFSSLARKGSESSSGRLRNIADGLAIAIGVPAQQVVLIPSAVPNVIALPTRSNGLVVVATEGAVELLSRRGLESLVASQIVVARDPWVRQATRAQLAQGPWAFLLATTMLIGFPGVIFFVLAFATIFLFVFTTLPRRCDAVRDLVADGVGIHTTKDPEALVQALRALRPAALAAPDQKLGIGMMVDPFAVLSVRLKSSTSVTVNGRTRSWSTEDEVATELGFRAERMERVARGDSSADDGLGPYRQAWSSLGRDENPYRLTDDERATGEATRTALLRQ